jgi:hypothetical protein
MTNQFLKKLCVKRNNSNYSNRELTWPMKRMILAKKNLQIAWILKDFEEFLGFFCCGARKLLNSANPGALEQLGFLRIFENS